MVTDGWGSGVPVGLARGKLYASATGPPGRAVFTWAPKHDGRRRANAIASAILITPCDISVSSYQCRYRLARPYASWLQRAGPRQVMPRASMRCTRLCTCLVIGLI